MEIPASKMNPSLHHVQKTLAGKIPPGLEFRRGKVTNEIEHWQNNNTRTANWTANSCDLRTLTAIKKIVPELEETIIHGPGTGPEIHASSSDLRTLMAEDQEECHCRVRWIRGKARVPESIDVLNILKLFPSRLVTSRNSNGDTMFKMPWLANQRTRC